MSELMKFVIRRASTWSDTKPVDNCNRENVVYKHERTCNSFEEYDEKFADREGSWISIGWGHCINEEGYIQRYEYRECWVIEFKTLEELYDFIKKHGAIIIEQYLYTIPTITIYDDYVE